MYGIKCTNCGYMEIEHGNPKFFYENKKVCGRFTLLEEKESQKIQAKTIETKDKKNTKEDEIVMILKFILVSSSSNGRVVEFIDFKSPVS